MAVKATAENRAVFPRFICAPHLPGLEAVGRDERELWEAKGDDEALFVVRRDLTLF
jgi:hypothetical protein